MDDMVPENHLLRLIEQSIDFDFIYDLVEDRYCPDNGRPSIDPVMLIKIQLIQCLYGIRSMRQTIKDIEMKVGLTFACINLKKLAKKKQRYGLLRPLTRHFSSIFTIFIDIFMTERKPGLKIA